MDDLFSDWSGHDFGSVAGRRQLSPSRPVRAAAAKPVAQVDDFRLLHLSVQGDKRQERASRLPEEDPQLPAGQHEVHGSCRSVEKAASL